MHAAIERPQLSGIEKLFILTALLLMIGALRGFFADLETAATAAGSVTEGDFKYQLFSGMIFLISGIVLLTRMELFIYFIRNNKAFFLFMTFALLSAMWSVEPWASFRRGVALWGTTVFAAYLVTRVSPYDLLKFLAWAFLLSAVASAIAVMLYPNVGIHHHDAHDGLWRGVFEHKNKFGRSMALGVIVMAMLLWDRSFPRLLGWAGLLLMLFFVLQAQSTTTWLALALALSLTIPLKVVRDAGSLKTTFYAFAFAVLAVIAAYVLVHNLEPILGMVDKDITLSARTRIWSLAIEGGMQNPLFGAGFHAFWTEANAGWYYGLVSWDANFGHSHNGYIDIFVEMGAIGLVLFAISVVVLLLRLFEFLKRDNSVLAIYFPVALAFILLTAMTERTVATQGIIEWVLFVSTTLYLTGVRQTEETSAAEFETSVPVRQL